jgi:hypothetical protein
MLTPAAGPGPAGPERWQHIGKDYTRPICVVPRNGSDSQIGVVYSVARTRAHSVRRVAARQQQSLEAERQQRLCAVPGVRQRPARASGLNEDRQALA